MTVLIKIGKRVQRGFTQRLKGPFLVQSMIWKNIEYGIGLAAHKMKQYQNKNPDKFQFTKRKFKEEDEQSLRYSIEWIEVVINSTPEIEEEEYQQTMKLFTELENHQMFKKGTDGVEVDEELAKEYNDNIKKGKVKQLLDAGYERIKGITLNKSLNDVGIITIVEKFEKKND